MSALSPAEQQFANGVAAGTGLDLGVVTAWEAQESGWNTTKPGSNYLNIGPGKSFGSVADAVKATVNLLKGSKSYAPILAAKTPQDQINAIAASPWDASHYGAAQGQNRLLDTYNSAVKSISSAFSSFLAPVTGGKITGKFGENRGDHIHEGEDFAVPVGTPVSASAGGKVTFAGQQSGYGNVVIVDNGNGLSTLYAHLSQIGVAVGNALKPGQKLGLSGGEPGTPGAGDATGPHLHFEIRKDGKAVDPSSYLSSTAVGGLTAQTAGFADTVSSAIDTSGLRNSLVKGLIYIVFLVGGLALIGLGLSRLTSVSAGDVVNKGSTVAGAIALLPK
jgi:murein DD-endopeptidase MepM/ murein hydrolase activator NlpD